MEISSAVLELFLADELSKRRSALQVYEGSEDWTVRSDEIHSKE
jgi:hypothetical protein